ncbi:unnamed protein product, partial [Symbiodinium sp. KB8]
VVDNVETTKEAQWEAGSLSDKLASMKAFNRRPELQEYLAKLEASYLGTDEDDEEELTASASVSNIRSHEAASAVAAGDEERIASLYNEHLKSTVTNQLDNADKRYLKRTRNNTEAQQRLQEAQKTLAEAQHALENSRKELAEFDSQGEMTPELSAEKAEVEDVMKQQEQEVEDAEAAVRKAEQFVEVTAKAMDQADSNVKDLRSKTQEAEEALKKFEEMSVADRIVHAKAEI